MRHLRNRASFGGLLTVAAMFVGTAAAADITPVFNVVTPTGGGDFEFSYNVNIAAGIKVETGNYFTIYDFLGYVPGSAFAPAGWDISIQNMGITPPTLSVIDDPSFVNITFAYTGAATLVGPLGPIGGVGAFGANSIYKEHVTPLTGLYASYSLKNDPGNPDDGTGQENKGSVTVPNTPEASSLMLLMPGLVPLGIMLRRQRLQKRA